MSQCPEGCRCDPNRATGEAAPAGELRPEAVPIVPLASLVRREALRAEAGERIRPDPVRLAAGWQRRFAIERSRAADLARLYEESGYEVALDPVSPELLRDECSDCRLVTQLEYVLLYTREAAGSAGVGDPTAAP